MRREFTAREEFIAEFTYRTTEHLQACFGPKLRKMQIGRIVFMQAVLASVDTDYALHRINILPVNLGQVTVLINDGIHIQIALEKRKEAVHG